MIRNLYALLVGIDAYPNPRHRLQGCVNDIERVANYLEGRTAGRQFRLHLEILKNEAAHRQAVIEGFRKHLRRAGPNDVALFYFSGHGSQEPADERFWSQEPDHMNETLVCWDSRSEGGLDLADKELCVLLHEVAERDPHIAVVLDCCHSGSGTRDALQQTATRRIPAAAQPRPWEQYLFAGIGRPRGIQGEGNGSGWFVLPEGRHILLAACHDNETAKEYFADGKAWGAFTYFLMNALENAKSALSYRDAFMRTQALVRSHAMDQYPQLEATRPRDAEQPFLGGAIAPRTPYFMVRYDRDWGWVMDGGSIHGIAEPVAGETTTLALFPFQATSGELQEADNTVGSARVTEVQPQLSKLEFIDLNAPDVSETFKGVVVDLPLPPMAVSLTGDEDGLAFVRTAFETSGPGGAASPFVRETSDTANFRVLAQEERYVITRPSEDHPLVEPVPGYSPSSARLVVRRLEHMARWQRLADLTNPSSRIPVRAVEMTVIADGTEISTPDVLLEYRRSQGRWRQPTFAIKLANRFNQRLYCAVLGFSENFAISAGYFPAGGVWLEPGAEIVTNLKYGLVPKPLWEAGVTERRDIIKLIASTTEFDAAAMEQGKLDTPPPTPASSRSVRHRHTLQRLARRIQTREAADLPEEEMIDDWVTSQIVLTTRRPQEDVPIQTAGRGIDLGAGVHVAPHPALKANARLTTIPESQRDLGRSTTPLIFRQYRDISVPFHFTSGRGFDPGLSVLELSDVADHTVVTPEEPLRVTVDMPLADDEFVLPYGFDGEFFLPLGRALRADGQTEIELQRLPAPISQGHRDLAGSVRILFRKIISQPLGLPFDGARLAMVTRRADGRLGYEDDPAKLRQRIAHAQRITLCVHGILGDTRAIASAVLDQSGSDLVLAFDYENINTPIEQIARSLKSKLADVGLGPDHGKRLQIVAHSMGGLVSRWFIEREGGNQVARHLVMLGTPNAGSPWPSLQGWVTAALGIALNGLAQALWPAAVLGGLASALEKVDVTLDQMQPGSNFLDSLQHSPDPGVPYTLIAGNTSLYPALLQNEDGEPGVAARLMRRLFARPLHHSLASLAFFHQPNDIAVSVTSMEQVADGPGRRMVVQEVGCDHMMYFSSQVGRAALAQALA